MNRPLDSVLAYSEGKFVNRPEFEQLVQYLYPTPDHASSTPSLSPPPPLYLQGAFGMGKSWLAYHLCSQSSDKLPPPIGQSTPDNIRLLVSLVTHPPASPPSDTIHFIQIPAQDETPISTEQIRTMLDWLAKKLTLSVPSHASASEIIYHITRDLSAQGRPLILLVDGLSKVPDSLLSDLESYLLAPLAALPHVRLVLVEPSSYPWRFPTLRVDGRKIEVNPFKEAQVSEQVTKLTTPPLPLDAPALEQIIEVGQCVPLHTACLAAKVAEKGITEGLRDGLEVIISYILRHVDGDDQARVRSYMEALSLREEGFHETMIIPLLVSHPKSEVKEAGSLKDLKQARDIRNQLFDAGLITSKGALYQMEQPTRQIFQRYLKTYQPDVWIALHEAAQRFFQDWSTKVSPTHKAYYQSRAQEHQTILDEARRAQS